MSVQASGFDLHAALSQPVTLEPGKRHLVSCGFAMAMPGGYEAQIRPRSGWALRYGVTVLNTPGTIDADYRGTVSVLLINLGSDAITIRRGDRIAQMVISPVVQPQLLVVQELPSSERGGGGFGHTGQGHVEKSGE